MSWRAWWSKFHRRLRREKQLEVPWEKFDENTVAALLTYQKVFKAIRRGDGTLELHFDLFMVLVKEPLYIYFKREVTNIE